MHVVPNANWSKLQMPITIRRQANSFIHSFIHVSIGAKNAPHNVCSEQLNDRIDPIRIDWNEPIRAHTSIQLK